MLWHFYDLGPAEYAIINLNKIKESLCSNWIYVLELSVGYERCLSGYSKLKNHGMNMCKSNPTSQQIFLLLFILFQRIAWSRLAWMFHTWVQRQSCFYTCLISNLSTIITSNLIPYLREMFLTRIYFGIICMEVLPTNLFTRSG